MRHPRKLSRREVLRDQARGSASKLEGGACPTFLVIQCINTYIYISVYFCGDTCLQALPQMGTMLAQQEQKKRMAAEQAAEHERAETPEKRAAKEEDRRQQLAERFVIRSPKPSH